MKNKLIAILTLCMVLCTAICGLTACNSNNKTEGLNYMLNEDNASYCVRGIGTAEDNKIVIPDKYKGKPVTKISDSAFSNTPIVSVTIGDSVTSIGSGAFYYCYSLTSITIPDSVTYIGNSAFNSCSALQYNIKDGLKYLGNENNKYLYLADTVSTDITTANIDSNCRFIGSYAFEDCSSLTSVIIPDSVTSVGNHAFYGCDSLTSVTIEDGVTSIGDWGFLYCSSLTSIIIGDGVTSIGNGAFCNCSSLTSITIPDSVTSIADKAFSSCSSLTSIIIPDSVTTIGGYEFSYCSSLTSITIPDTVTSIGINTFYDCSSLEIIYCEAESQPSAWDSYWKYNSSAEVVWNYKNN